MPPPRISFQTLVSRLRVHRSSASPLTQWKRPLLLSAQLFVAGHLIVSYIGTIGPTDGISMVPTISHSYIHRPYILESRLHRRGRNIHVGDIITFTHPTQPSSSMCKRVVGLPGDFVSVVSKGREEKDLGKAEGEGEWARVRESLVQVPEGHCWVAGDNLEWSRDSRIFGAVPLGLVRGKVMGIVWPWKDSKWFGPSLQDVQHQEHEWVAG